MSQQGEAAEQIVNMATNVTVKGVECLTIHPRSREPTCNSSIYHHDHTVTSRNLSLGDGIVPIWICFLS